MTCLDFIESHTGERRDLLLALHEFMLSFPQVTAKIRHRVPFYYRKHWICYLNPLKNESVELCFVRANELSNAQGLLDFKDRVQVAGITLRRASDIPEDALFELLHEALLLDDTPYRKPKGK